MVTQSIYEHPGLKEPSEKLTANPENAKSSSVGRLALPESVLKIPMSVQVMIGSARIPLSQVAQLEPGSIISLEQPLGAPAVILVNGKEVARGDLFVLDGEGDRLGISITEVAPAQKPDT